MNMELLEQKIIDSGYKKEYIAGEIGLSRFGLLSKIQNPDRWKITEVKKITKLLNLTRSESKEIFGY